ncbi:MAG: hypothetical protein JO179_23430 [Solirubrobacterales bacterium]|nr:hypothetical protein [Solirubrobacterales bacterium]
MSTAQQLADKYSPIVMMRSQTNAPCDTTEEQFWPPTSVDVVLGNPRVRLLKRGSAARKSSSALPLPPISPGAARITTSISRATR